MVTNDIFYNKKNLSGFYEVCRASFFEFVRLKYKVSDKKLRSIYDDAFLDICSAIRQREKDVKLDTSMRILLFRTGMHNISEGKQEYLLVDDLSTFEDEKFNQDEYSEMYNWVVSLPSPCRDIMFGVYSEGLAPEEITEQLGLTDVSVVEERKRKCIEHFRKQWREVDCTIDPEVQKQVDCYVLERMSAKEQNKFEQQMQTEMALKDLEIDTRLLVELIREILFDKNLVASIQALPEEDIQSIIQEKRANRRFMYYSAWALVAIMILAFVVRMGNMPKENSPEWVYLTYYNSVPGEPSKVVQESINKFPGSMEQAVRDGFKEYKKGNYFEAQALFESVVKPGEWKKYPEVIFFLSLCELEINRPDRAIVWLENLTSLGVSFPYYEQSFWYLGLAYVKQEELGKAQRIFQQISSGNGPYAKKAKDLLENLNDRE